MRITAVHALGQHPQHSGTLEDLLMRAAEPDLHAAAATSLARAERVRAVTVLEGLLLDETESLHLRSAAAGGLAVAINTGSVPLLCNVAASNPDPAWRRAAAGTATTIEVESREVSDAR